MEACSRVAAPMGHQSSHRSGSAHYATHTPAGHGRETRAPVFPAHVADMELVDEVLVDLVVAALFLTSPDEPASELGTTRETISEGPQ